MKKFGIIFIIVLILAGVGVALYFGLNQEPIRSDFVSLNLLNGEYSHTRYSGYATDGDLEATGALEQFRYPEISASDGESSALASQESTHSKLMGTIEARKGPQSKENAVAYLMVESSSGLKLDSKQSFRYLIDVKIRASINEGVGTYIAAVEIVDSDKQVVPGSEYEIYYSVMKDHDSMINVTYSGDTTKRIGEAKDFNRVDVSEKEIHLNPGEYVVKFKMRIKAQAKSRSKMQTVAELDLVQ